MPLRNVISLGFDPAGSRLMTGTSSGDGSIWDIPSARRIHHLHDIGEPINRVAFSPDRQHVTAALSDGSQLVWRAGSGRLPIRLKNHDRTIWSTEFDRAGKLLLSAAAGGSVVVTEVETARPLVQLTSNGHIADAHFDPRSQRVVAASLDGTARVWNVRSPYRRWSSQEIEPDCGTDLSREPDRRFLAVGCTDHETRIWDTASDTLLATLPRMGQSRERGTGAWPAVSVDGELAAIAQGNAVDVYALPGGRLVRTIRHRARVTTLRFSSRGHALVTGSEDGGLRVLSGAEAEERELPALAAAVDAAAFLPDGRLVAVDADRQLTICDVDRRARVASLRSPMRVAALRISGDGMRMLAMPFLGTQTPPILWDLARPTIIAKLEGHQGQVYAARFVRDDRDLLTAGTDGTARRWDSLTGQPRQTFFAVPMLFDATLSPDGAMVVGADVDGNVRFWDASSGAELWVLRAHRLLISGLHFEGDALITRAGTGDITRWTLPTPSPVGSSTARFERLVRCGRLGFDEASGSLVTQSLSCPGRQP